MWNYLDVEGISTRYRDQGTGSPIVLIHGGEIGAGTADTWPESLIDKLSTDHRVIAFDRLGSGYTGNPPTSEEFRMSSVVKHAASLLAMLDVQGATMVGQSRGAFVASRLSKLFPHLTSRLVIINSASISVRLPVEPLPGTLTYDTYYRAFNGDDDHDAKIMSVTTDHMTDEWVAARTAISQLPKTKEARETFSELWNDIFAEFEVLKNDTLKWFIGGGHDKPTLIVWGVGDPTTTARDAFDLFEVFTPHVDQLRLHMINRSGHWPHREYPDEVGREIAEFISATH